MGDHEYRLAREGSDFAEPAGLYAFVIGQAAVVALLGELQYIGLRR